MKTMHGIALAGAAALVLAACGGSGSGNGAPAATTDVPASAQENAAGLVTFVNQQVGASSETAEPFLVGDAVLPVDDTAETSL